MDLTPTALDKFIARALARQLEAGQLEAFLDALIPYLDFHLVEQLRRGFDEHHLFDLQPIVDNGKTEYTIFECLRPATFWGFVDLSKARQGDLFSLKLLMKVGKGDFHLHESYELEHQRQEPIITLTARFAPASKLLLAQVRGITKPVTIEIFARYEDASQFLALSP